MQVIWAPHAESQLNDIVLAIAEDMSADDGLRWESKIRSTTNILFDNPLFGKNVPAKCFFEPPEDIERLHQLICDPYRIVYEPTSVACYILSIRHCRMMLRSPDTYWN